MTAPPTAPASLHDGTVAPALSAPLAAILTQCASVRAQLVSVNVQLDAIEAMVLAVGGAQHAAALRAERERGPRADARMPGPVFGRPSAIEEASSGQHDTTSLDALTDRLSSIAPRDAASSSSDGA